ncbi:uncharacterized protein LOC142973858 [Anticarsia gemmatalis]|uniref:uncharacterized protein LOC142973858 n=1 Tax=Anticarsia gemmatalis TaxID=129554 RepID=UPI003F761E6E
MLSLNFVYFVVVAGLVAISSGAPANDVVNTSIKIPEQCKDMELCSIKPEGYSELEELFNSKLPPYLIQPYSDRSDDNSNQPPILSPESDWHNCPYTTKITLPYLHSNTKKNITRFIIQTDLLRQELPEVSCSTTHITAPGHRECFQDLLHGEKDLKSTCVESKTKLTIYLFDMDRKEVIQEFVPVSSSCSCMISYTTTA